MHPFPLGSLPLSMLYINKQKSVKEEDLIDY